MLGQGVEGRDHLVELQAIGFLVVVRIAVDRDTGGGEEGAVIVPGRIADPYRALREVAFQEVRGDADRSRAAERLDGGDALLLHGRVIGAEHEFLHGLAVLRHAFHWQVGMWCALLVHPFGRLTHAAEHGNLAVGVVVQADAQVDLMVARVGLEGFEQRQDGVAGVKIDVFKHDVTFRIEEKGCNLYTPAAMPRIGSVSGTRIRY